MTHAVLLRRASLQGHLVDVHWARGRIVDIARHRAGRRSAATGGGWASAVDEVDCRGGTVVPGIHDHHIHLMALAAAAQRSIVVGPPAVRDRAELAAVLTAAARRTRGESGGELRGVGYHESVAGELDAALLDALVPAARSVPVRVQHRSGQLWILNRRALAESGLEDHDHPGIERDARGAPTGRIFGADDLLRRSGSGAPPDLAAVGRELAGYGVTGVTDLTPLDDVEELRALVDAAATPGFPVRLTVTGSARLAGRLNGMLSPEAGVGPVKILPPEHDLPHPDELAATIARVHRAKRAVAVHCVSRVGLVIALVAFRSAGTVAGDRIEHGSVIPGELLDELRGLGVTVVTQPNFVAERGDQYLADFAVDEHADIWRCRSLAAAGIGVAGGTDAPFGHPNPWRAMAAATERLTESGVRLGADECLAPGEALGLFMGTATDPLRPRRISAGATTDLCVLEHELALDELAGTRVLCTVGRAGVTYAAPDHARYGHPPSTRSTAPVV